MEILLNFALTFTLIASVLLLLEVFTDVATEIGGKFQHYYELTGGASILLALGFWFVVILVSIWT